MLNLAAPIVRVLIALGVAAALGAACYLVGHAQGYATGKVECAQAQVKAAASAVTQANTAVAATRKVEESHVRAQQKARVVYRTIIQRVHDHVRANPSYADCGLDADGVRLWNAASAGTLPGTAAEPDDRLRAAAAPSAAAAASLGSEAPDAEPPGVGIEAPGGERSRDAGEPR